MPNPKNRFADNVPGAWYVDDQCIGCGLCGNDAPAIFSPAPAFDHYRVHRQPVSADEQRDAEDARERCPVEAIGNDAPF